MILYYLLQLAALVSSSEIGFNGPKSGDATVRNILLTVYFWAGVLATIALIIGGFMYTTSQDDPNLVTRAKNTILGAAIGLVVVLLAFAITSIILGAFR
jgi:hypothetical protein